MHVVQNLTEATQVVVSKRVAEITSEPEILGPPDISASASILTDLTDGATANPEVLFYWLPPYQFNKINYVSLQVRDNFLEIIDNIQKADSVTILISQIETNSSSR